MEQRIADGEQASGGDCDHEEKGEHGAVKGGFLNRAPPIRKDELASWSDFLKVFAAQRNARADETAKHSWPA